MEGKEEVVYDSISTIKELGDTTKTAYGPFGMNKIVQNHIEKLFLTSDAATMIKELDIRHPAAKMVVMAAHQQEEETGKYFLQQIPHFFKFSNERGLLKASKPHSAL
jgi:T-complex protein 1 subunit theta